MINMMKKFLAFIPLGYGNAALAVPHFVGSPFTHVKRTYVKFFLAAIFALISFAAQAETIDIQNEEKTFGDWKVFCEIDQMMDLAHCKIAAKFFDNSSVINIEPAAKSLNQFFIIIPQIKLGGFVQIRVDKNDLILSKNASAKDFGMINLSDEQKLSLFHQMKNGDFLFLRFGSKTQEKEATVRISLKDFRSALSYHNLRATK